MAISYQYPFHEPYKLGTPFGEKGTLWKCGYHSGLDLLSGAAGSDGLVYAIAPGKVEKCVPGNVSYGNYVIVRHEDGMLSLYAHLKRIAVTPGQKVDLSTVLGAEGATGNVTGAHLHLELHKESYRYPATIDPAAFLEAAQRESGSSDGSAHDNEPDDYAKDAVAWAISSDLLRGDERGDLHLHDPVTRQDAAVLLHRMNQMQQSGAK